MPNNFSGRLRNETRDSEATSHGHRLGDVDDHTDLLKKIITGDELWVYSYDYAIETKAISSHPNGNVQKYQDRKKHDKFGQM